jgi:inosine/xanthosine triphosphatase
MRICVGSKNKVKLESVKEVIQDYDFLKSAEVIGLDVPSDISEQPLSLSETIQGAKNRAKAAFQDCDYSIGMESGFMKVPEARTDYMEQTVCVIYDGNEFHIGFGPSFECPQKVMDLILTKGYDLNQACKELGLTDKEKIGGEEGIVGLLTKGRISRKNYTKPAIIMALIHLEN